MLKSELVVGSGSKTASAVILSQPGALSGMMISTDGTNAVTVNLYDNASAASGTKLIPTWIVPSSSINRSAALEFTPPKQCDNGIYAEISVAGGGSCSYVVDYIPGGSLQ